MESGEYYLDVLEKIDHINSNLTLLLEDSNKNTDNITTLSDFYPFIVIPFFIYIIFRLFFRW